MSEATANRAWQAAVVVAHNLVFMVAAEVAAEVAAGCANGSPMRSRRKTPSRRARARPPHNLQLLRRWLINVPARVVHRARQVFVRLAAGMLWGTVFKRTYDRLTC
jgi:hypothetical protein